MMKNLLAFTTILLVATLVHAVPARPLYEPPAMPKPIVTPSLVGTTWIGKLYTEGEKITFYADGALLYGDAGSGSPGSWKLEGDQLYFDVNKYSEYKTTVKGDIIEGIGWNKGGQQTKPLLRRVGTFPALGVR